MNRNWLEDGAAPVYIRESGTRPLAATRLDDSATQVNDTETVQSVRAIRHIVDVIDQWAPASLESINLCLCKLRPLVYLQLLLQL